MSPDRRTAMRLPFADSPYPWTLRLVAINCIVFFFQFITKDSALGQTLFVKGLYLNPDTFRFGALWQLVSYMFCHSTVLGRFLGIPLPTHLFFNMFLLWMFGREVELTLGSRAFLRLYFAAGLVAGICALIPGFITGRPTLGASGAVLGILAAFGHLFPDRIVLLMFIIPIRVRYLIWLIAALDLFGAMSGGFGGNIAHLAHIGGLFTGMLMMRKGWYRRSFLDLSGWRRRRDLDRERRERARVDHLLDKISREGLDSLTPEERAFLERVRRGR